MTPQLKLKEIKDKWTHSRMDYTDSQWLIKRIEQLENALDYISIPNNENRIKKFTDSYTAREALEEMP